MVTLALTVNGRRTTVETDPDMPLLYVLRNDLGLHPAKFGCGLGQYGACASAVRRLLPPSSAPRWPAPESPRGAIAGARGD